nr:hypothetical protein [Bacteroidota bacterium]
MKKLTILSILFSYFILPSCVQVKYNKIDDTIIYENQKVQFGEINDNWRENFREGKKFNNIHSFLSFENGNYRSTIWIRSYKMKREMTGTSREAVNQWIAGMTIKYKWEDFKKLDEGTGKIDGVESYWQVYRFIFSGAKIL